MQTSHARLTYTAKDTCLNLDKLNCILSIFSLWVCFPLTPECWCAFFYIYMSSAERAVGEGERMLDVLQRWGQHRAEVRFFLRHNRAPSRESGNCPSWTHNPNTHPADNEAGAVFFLCAPLAYKSQFTWYLTIEKRHSTPVFLTPEIPAASKHGHVLSGELFNWYNRAGHKSLNKPYLAVLL